VISHATAFILAAVSVAAPSPAPTAAPILKEIGSVHVSSYCTAFYRNFNAAVHPLLQNDATLEQTSAALDGVNNLWSALNWDQKFIDERLRLEKYVGSLLVSTHDVQMEVNQLRQGERETNDPQRAQAMHMLAQELQRAVDKQVQMTTDLHWLVVGMMDFDIASTELTHPLGGITLADMRIPAQGKDIKAYLRFDGMRDRLRDAETKAAGWAGSIVQNYC